jgi:hypothetical protein
MVLEHIFGPQVSFGTIYNAIGWLSESRNNLCEEGSRKFFRNSKRFVEANQIFLFLILLKKRTPKNI